MEIAQAIRNDSHLPAWSPEAFEAQLRDKGRSYHIHHPFNVRMNSGGCTPDEIRCWVANRFYYQICIPRKDAAVLANMPDREHRRLWVERILDHDGQGDFEGSAAGGIEAWVRLGAAAGIGAVHLAALMSGQGTYGGIRHALPLVVLYVAWRREGHTLLKIRWPLHSANAKLENQQGQGGCLGAKLRHRLICPRHMRSLFMLRRLDPAHPLSGVCRKPSKVNCMLTQNGHDLRNVIGKPHPLLVGFHRCQHIRPL